MKLEIIIDKLHENYKDGIQTIKYLQTQNQQLASELVIDMCSIYDYMKRHKHQVAPKHLYKVPIERKKLVRSLVKISYSNEISFKVGVIPS